LFGFGAEALLFEPGSVSLFQFGKSVVDLVTRDLKASI
jgi:hypothetical protein